MKSKIQIDAEGVLLFGLMLFSLSWREMEALVTAAVAHEAGHVLAFCCAGMPPTGIRFTLSGPVLICREPESKLHAVIVVLAGPVAGMILSGCLYHIWRLCAEISFLLSIVNLMPVLPLDGGRLLRLMTPANTEVWLQIAGFLFSAVWMLAGLCLIYHGKNGFGILLFGVWLLILSCQEQQFDVK